MIQDFVGKHVWDAVAAQPYLIALIALLILLFGSIMVARLTRLISTVKAQNDLLHETLLALRKR